MLLSGMSEFVPGTDIAEVFIRSLRRRARPASAALRGSRARAESM